MLYLGTITDNYDQAKIFLYTNSGKYILKFTTKVKNPKLCLYQLEL